jgi:cation diffusion facilitator family transporter
MTEVSTRPADPAGVNHKQHAAQQSTLVSAVVNTLLSAAQIVVGLFAHSSGLVADGVHSLSDLLADFVVLIANRYSHKAADQEHPYGHFRFETAASLLLGGLLLVVGLGMLWSSAMKFRTPELIPQVHVVALWVALAALLSKECLFRYMLAVARRVRSSMLAANAWHARSDAASSLVVALGIIGNLLGFPLFDPLAAAIVGFLVSRMGWHFGYDAFQDLMDRGLEQNQVDALHATLTQTEGVVNAHDVRTRKMGDLVLVDAHLRVNSHISVSEGHQVALKAQHRLMQQHSVADATIHIDADGDDEGANLDLPSRQLLLRQINQQLGESALHLEQLQAHYLDGRVELDILLPAEAAELATRCLDLAALPKVTRLRIFLQSSLPT